jgi:hypothetical protein
LETSARSWARQDGTEPDPDDWYVIERAITKREWCVIVDLRTGQPIEFQH